MTTNKWFPKYVLDAILLSELIKSERLNASEVNIQDDHVLYVFKMKKKKITFCYLVCNEEIKIQEPCLIVTGDCEQVFET